MDHRTLRVLFALLWTTCADNEISNDTWPSQLGGNIASIVQTGSAANDVRVKVNTVKERTSIIGTAGKICTCTGDPHCVSFDGFHFGPELACDYMMIRAADFELYARVTQRKFQDQVQHWIRSLALIPIDSNAVPPVRLPAVTFGRENISQYTDTNPKSFRSGPMEVTVQLSDEETFEYKLELREAGTPIMRVVIVFNQELTHLSFDAEILEELGSLSGMCGNANDDMEDDDGFVTFPVKIPDEPLGECDEEPVNCPESSQTWALNQCSGITPKGEEKRCVHQCCMLHAAGDSNMNRCADIYTTTTAPPTVLVSTTPMVPDECRENPCANDGQCVVTGGVQTCDCTGTGHRGTYCTECNPNENRNCYPPRPDDMSGHCKCMGDPHCQTLDKYSYTFHGVCDYLVWKSAKGDFEIYARNSLWDPAWGRALSGVQRVVLFPGGSQKYVGDAILIDNLDGDFQIPSGTVKANGWTIQTSLTTSAYLTQKLETTWKIELTMNGNSKPDATLKVAFFKDKYKHIGYELKLEETLKQAGMQGQCGDWDDHATNDWEFVGPPAITIPGEPFGVCTESGSTVTFECNVKESEQWAMEQCSGGNRNYQDCFYDCCALHQLNAPDKERCAEMNIELSPVPKATCGGFQNKKKCKEQNQRPPSHPIGGEDPWEIAYDNKPWTKAQCQEACENLGLEGCCYHWDKPGKMMCAFWEGSGDIKNSNHNDKDAMSCEVPATPGGGVSNQGPGFIELNSTVA